MVAFTVLGLDIRLGCKNIKYVLRGQRMAKDAHIGLCRVDLQNPENNKHLDVHAHPFNDEATAITVGASPVAYRSPCSVHSPPPVPCLT